MAEIARWRGHSWGAFGTVIRSFKNMTMNGECATEEKGGDEKYAAVKNPKPATLSMTLVLMKAVGCEPMTEAMQLVEEARSGADDYLYINDALYANYKMMLTKCAISNTVFSPNGEMTECEAALTFTQSSMSNGKLYSSGSGKDDGKDKGKKTISEMMNDAFNAAKVAADNITPKQFSIDKVTEVMLQINTARTTAGQVDAVTEAQPVNFRRQ